MNAIVTAGEQIKMGVVSEQLLPDHAVLDAELTLGLPPVVTADTGVDAMGRWCGRRDRVRRRQLHGRCEVGGLPSRAGGHSEPLRYKRGGHGAEGARTPVALVGSDYRRNGENV